ncbi:ferredoxin [Nocardia sp. NPDC004604]|uniref:ferredoxin n=1 Tax=Nocardia sp. NPDC004604 TaxID=3157013 RepID=UPI0033ADB882
MRVLIDADKCQGHLRCMGLAPEVFDCDDLGYGVVILTGPVPAGSEQLMRRCAANCPEQAISIR